MLAKMRILLLLPLVGLLLYGGYRYHIHTQGGRVNPGPLRLTALETKALAGRRIALLSGHAGFDPGAVCDDGLTEAHVNRQITDAMAQLLTEAAAHPLLLQEYDPRLHGLRADAFLSIHADSCLSRKGFKIARWAQSPHPRRDDRLLRCLRYNYWITTGLPIDELHITDDMRFYHAFRKIDPRTPGVIIETGYLGGDRDLLVRHPRIPALGLTRGLACFFQDAQD